MTAYNAVRYVEKALLSIHYQSTLDYEVVIVNDGSTDETAKQIHRVARLNQRMRVIHLDQNVGISEAANIGLEACRGTYIARLDADDIAHPQRLERQLRVLRNSDAVCLGSYVDFIDEAGRRLKTVRSPRENAEIQQGLLEGHCTIWHTSSMIRADALRRVGGYNPEFRSAVDIDLWLRLGEHGRLANHPEVLQKYRFYGESISGTRRDEQRAFCRRAAEEASARRSLPRPEVDSTPWRTNRRFGGRYADLLQKGWWAYKSGEVETAHHYGRRALCRNPVSRQAWALACKTPVTT